MAEELTFVANCKCGWSGVHTGNKNTIKSNHCPTCGVKIRWLAEAMTSVTSHEQSKGGSSPYSATSGNVHTNFKQRFPDSTETIPWGVTIAWLCYALGLPFLTWLLCHLLL